MKKGCCFRLEFGRGDSQGEDPVNIQVSYRLDGSGKFVSRIVQLCVMMVMCTVTMASIASGILSTFLVGLTTLHLSMAIDLHWEAGEFLKGVTNYRLLLFDVIATH